MATGMLFSAIDGKCMFFAAISMVINFMCLRLVDDWTSKIFISGMCLFFLFCAFALDAWLSHVQDENWKSKNLLYEPTEHSQGK